MNARYLGATLIALSIGVASLADEAVIRRALQDEMDRTLARLQIDVEERPNTAAYESNRSVTDPADDIDSAAPYFVSYTVHDDESINVTAINGGTSSRTRSKSRSVTMELRVGDYAFDNTNFLSRGVLNSISLPLADDYWTIRRKVWLLTDRVFRHAVDTLVDKRAALQNMSFVDPIPDFSPAGTFVYQDTSTHTSLDADAITGVIDALSEASLDYPHLYDSRITAHANRHRDFYVNSEGSSFTRNDDESSLTVRLSAKGPFFRELRDAIEVYGRGWSETMPPAGELVHQLRDAASRLKDRYDSPGLTETYNGPVLVESQAAPMLVAHSLAPLLLNSRKPSAPPAQRQIIQQFPDNPFKDKINARILARELSIYDDPNLTEYDSQPVVGSWPVDTEGIKPRYTSLVERGVLKTLLSNRNPSREVSGSTGSDHNGLPAISTLVMESSRGLTDAEMREELLMLVAEFGHEFGIIVRRLEPDLTGQRMRNPTNLMDAARGTVSTTLLEAVRLYPSGVETVIKTANLVRFEVSSMKDIVAASETKNVLNTRATFLSLGAGSALSHPFSVVAPSLLLEDATIAPPRGDIPMPPILAPPSLLAQD